MVVTVSKRSGSLGTLIDRQLAVALGDPLSGKDSIVGICRRQNLEFLGEVLTINARDTALSSLARGLMKGVAVTKPAEVKGRFALEAGLDTLEGLGYPRLVEATWEHAR